MTIVLHTSINFIDDSLLSLAFASTSFNSSSVVNLLLANTSIYFNLDSFFSCSNCMQSILVLLFVKFAFTFIREHVHTLVIIASDDRIIESRVLIVVHVNSIKDTLMLMKKIDFQRFEIAWSDRFVQLWDLFAAMSNDKIHVRVECFAFLTRIKLLQWLESALVDEDKRESFHLMSRCDRFDSSVFSCRAFL